MLTSGLLRPTRTAKNRLQSKIEQTPVHKSSGHLALEVYFIVGYQQISLSAGNRMFLSLLWKSGAGSEWRCIQLEAPLHLNPSAGEEPHQECVSENMGDQLIVIKLDVSDQNYPKVPKVMLGKR